jgi:hypothetical protein
VDSSTSVRLKWKPPVLDLEALDPPIEGYLLAWRPGGHRNLGFKEQVMMRLLMSDQSQRRRKRRRRRRRA